MGDLTQPAAEGLPAPDRSGLADQDQERGLESVLHVIGVAEHDAAGAQHLRTVPPDQGRKRRLIPPREEPIQELAVGETGQRPLGQQAVHLPQRTAHPCPGHDRSLPRPGIGSPFDHHKENRTGAR